MTTRKTQSRRARPGRPVRVLHRAHQKLATTECRSVRDSNVSGFLELEGIVHTNLAEAIGDPTLNVPYDALLVPKIAVVAIVYTGDGGERVVSLRPADDGEPDPAGELD